VPEFRRGGVYRALVRERMAEATTRGATLALVHAKAQTSSPILQRLGFVTYGQQRDQDKPQVTTRPDRLARPLERVLPIFERAGP
jgi:hypothetical protein